MPNDSACSRTCFLPAPRRGTRHICYSSSFTIQEAVSQRKENLFQEATHSGLVAEMISLSRRSMVLDASSLAGIVEMVCLSPPPSR